MEVKFFLNKDVNFNANFYFGKSKKLKSKIIGNLEIIEKTKKDIEEFESRKEEYLEKKEKKEKIKLIKKKEWYEKFRYTFTSCGLLVVIGKDAGTNEILIKKHAEEGDIIFHTQEPSSPFGIVKGGENKLSKNELEEVAQFICCFSAQWKKGFGTADAFWVLPDQVSKKAESGEYMNRGSFMIRGKKNIIKNIPLRICLGIRRIEIKNNEKIDNLIPHQIPSSKKEEQEDKIFYDELFSGSENACKKYCNNKFIKLEPGQDNYKKLTKEIRKKLKGHIEDLPKYIPNNCRILKR